MMNASMIQVDVLIPTHTKYLDLIGSIGERIAKELDSYTGDKEALAYQLNLVLTEATANVIKHANDANHKDTVRISIHIFENILTIKVFDHGQGFDLSAVPEPDFDNPQEHGMGLFFIRSTMDSVTYVKNGDENRLEMIKYLN
jgi:serine/threonine-protein kinase RsbW